MFKTIYSTKINVIANFAGSLWGAILAIGFVPVYLHYIKIEAYGLIGIFTSIQIFIMLLDFGISPTFNRELARLSACDDGAQEMHDLKRTLETPNWILAGLIALLLAALSPVIANFWLQPKELSVQTVTAALMIMGVNVAIQFTLSFYVGGLLGLQKQLLTNIINVACGTLRSVGAFLILAYVSPTILAFLAWQTIIVILQFAVIFSALKYSLPLAPHKGRFQKDIFHKVWRFAAGMTGITLVSLVLTQTDKVILSRMLNLEAFGYYTLAVTISSMSVMTIVSAINNATYPKFSRYVLLDDETVLSEFYHRSCQIMSAILIPTVVILAFFSYQILLVWTNKEEIAANTYLLLSLVAIGTGLNGLMWLPFHLQLAYGWTKLALYINIAAIFILVPLIVIGVYRYGAAGGAMAWIILNGSYILISIQIMHRRILKNEMLKWYFEDVGIPLLITLLVAGVGKRFLTFGGSRIENILELAGISILTLLFAVLSTKAGREIALALKAALRSNVPISE